MTTTNDMIGKAVNHDAKPGDWLTIQTDAGATVAMLVIDTYPGKITVAAHDRAVPLCFTYDRLTSMGSVYCEAEKPYYATRPGTITKVTTVNAPAIEQEEPIVTPEFMEKASNVARINKERAVVNDIRYTQVRDRLGVLGYRRQSSHNDANLSDNGIMQMHIYSRPSDGQKIIVSLQLTRQFEILAVDVYSEVSTSIEWNEYFASIK